MKVDVSRKSAAKTGRYNRAFLRVLYKYQYYLTKREKAGNPDWGQFITEMDKLYLPCTSEISKPQIKNDLNEVRK